MNLLVEGVFDIFHEDHQKFIKKCVTFFKERKGVYPACLKVNVMSNQWAHRKGINRPFFDESTRKSEVDSFIKIFQEHIPVLKTGICDKAAFEYTDKEDLMSRYPQYEIALCSDNLPKVQTKDFPFLEVPPVNIIHTSNIEERLLQLQSNSTNKIRKVAAVVVQNGKIIAEGFNVEGDSTCPKCSLFACGKIDMARASKCNHPHAEVAALEACESNIKNSALIVTTAPCNECAVYIIKNKVPLVVYLEDYIRVGSNENDTTGIQSMRNSGISIRKAGVPIL
jgi:deoxycytidylate deaminase